LILVGTGVDFEEIYNFAQTLNFPKEMITFTGEQTPQEVAEWFAKSDLLVMFSNYENAPVVISESLAMGKPVVSTNVGGISEMIDQSNGFLVEIQNESALANKINFMLDNIQKYDAEKIINEAFKKYSYQSVGKKIISIYSKILKS
jgi:glycosyltransferase involved in cell wall biosynthesis